MAGAGYSFGVMKPAADAARARIEQAASAATQDSITAAAGPTQAELDNLARLEEQRRIDSLTTIAFERRMADQRRTDSIRAARESRLAAKQAADTRTKSAVAPTGTKTGGTETQAAPQQQAPAQQQAAPVEPPAPAAIPMGTVRLGSTTPGAVLYVNGAVEGALSSLRVVSVPAGSVRLTIRAPGCEPWDSIVTVSAGTSISWQGRRMAKCP